RLLGNILKSSVSTIAKEKMALSNHSPGAALHGNALEMAKLSAAEFRKMIHIDMHVTGDEQIHVAVTVVVSPGCPGAEASHAYSGLFRHVFKCAVALVVVKDIAAVAGYVEVQKAVVIKIRNCHAHTPAFARQPRFFGDIGELQVGILVIQGDHGIPALAISVNG